MTPIPVRELLLESKRKIFPETNNSQSVGLTTGSGMLTGKLLKTSGFCAFQKGFMVLKNSCENVVCELFLKPTSTCCITSAQSPRIITNARNIRKENLIKIF